MLKSAGTLATLHLHTTCLRGYARISARILTVVAVVEVEVGVEVEVEVEVKVEVVRVEVVAVQTWDQDMAR
jgi:hypothetical protein